MSMQNICGIPYGVADFNDFRVKNYYYIDKTRFIRNIEEKGNFLFFIRPRRFGKSLFLGLLGDYYDITLEENFDYLFNGTNIHKNPTPEKNSYMVLKFNFSLVYPNLSLIEKEFVYYIKNTSHLFLLRYQHLLDIDIDRAKFEIENALSASGALQILLDYCKGKKHKLYVIIDEYDNFANTILAEAGENEFEKITHGQGFLRAFFNVLKGGTSESNSPISRLFMTGVSPITLDDVTSGFNIASNISLDSDLDEMMGFTLEEVSSIIEYYRQTGKIVHSTSQLLDIMSRWYNNYRFSLYSTSGVFNSVQVWYFIKEYLQDSRLPIEMSDRNVRIDYNKLRHLILIDQKDTKIPNGNFSQLRQIMETGTVHSPIIRGFPVEELLETENFTSLLYYFGLLTIDGVDEANEAILKIPNESIRRLFYDYIQETYKETHIFTLKINQYEKLIKDMAFKGQWKPLIEFLAERIDASLGLRDLITGEKSIQAMLNVYLGLSQLYFISSEKELNKGYADLVLEPFLAQYPAIKYSYLIEIKYIKPADYSKTKDSEKSLQNVIEEAQTQLNKYAEDEHFLKSIGSTTLKKLLLVFAGTKLIHHNQY